VSKDQKSVAGYSTVFKKVYKQFSGVAPDTLQISCQICLAKSVGLISFLGIIWLFDQKSVAGYSTVFKKVLNKFKDYGKLENINYDFKSQLFESFLKESISKKNWGQFFTPLKVIRSIEKMANSEIKEGAVICDPACGVGKFLLEPIKSKLSDFYEITDTKVIPKITIRGFDKGFDNDEQKTIILAKANMLIYFSDLIKEKPHLTKEFSAVFNDTFNLKTNSILGTLSEPTKNEYDLILTNPPYVTSGSSNLKDEIAKDKELENYYS
jgi:type I restriction-modification system DNA methylase subunit